MADQDDDRIARLISRTAGVLIIGGLIYAAGAITALTNSWPWSALTNSVSIVSSLIRDGEVIPPGRRVRTSIWS